jgi:rhodanese-related sulfurtransferase
MVHNVTARQAQELISRGEVEVIDVREPSEFSTGHLPGAKLVPLARLRTATKKVLRHDGVLFVCAAGVRSETAARLAASIGLEKVYSLRGGTQGWTREGLPLVTELSVAV